MTLPSMYNYLTTLSTAEITFGIVVITCLLFCLLVVITDGVKEEIENDWIYGTKNNYKYNADQDEK